VAAVAATIALRNHASKTNSLKSRQRAHASSSLCVRLLIHNHGNRAIARRQQQQQPTAAEAFEWPTGEIVEVQFGKNSPRSRATATATTIATA